jgi:hypothetical protein
VYNGTHYVVDNSTNPEGFKIVDALFGRQVYNSESVISAIVKHGTEALMFNSANYTIRLYTGIN